MNMSKQGIYDQLTSEAGEQFTPKKLNMLLTT